MHTETVERVIQVSSEDFGLTPADILSRRRSKTVAEARAIVCYLLRMRTFMSFPEIGRALKKDHSTVIYAVSRVERNTDLLCRAAVIAARIEHISQIAGGV